MMGIFLLHLPHKSVARIKSTTGKGSASTRGLFAPLSSRRFPSPCLPKTLKQHPMRHKDCWWKEISPFLCTYWCFLLVNGEGSKTLHLVCLKIHEYFRQQNIWVAVKESLISRILLKPGQFQGHSRVLQTLPDRFPFSQSVQSSKKKI